MRHGHGSYRAVAALAAVLALSVFATAPLDAQGLAVAGGVSASTLKVTRAGNSTAELSGPVLGAGAGARFGRISLDATYLEGQLSPSASSLGSEEVFAEASLIVSARLGGGFSLGAGPRARAFIATGGTVRWMRVEARGRYESEVVPGIADVDAELWQVLSGEVNAQGGSDGGRGGTVGLSVRLPNARFALRLGYVADRVAFVNGSSEFVDAVEIGLRIRPY